MLQCFSLPDVDFLLDELSISMREILSIDGGEGRVDALLEHPQLAKQKKSDMKYQAASAVVTCAFFFKYFVLRKSAYPRTR